MFTRLGAEDKFNISFFCLLRTIFNMSHVIMGVTNGSNGKVWVRVKVKLPDNITHVPGSGEPYVSMSH